MQIQHPPQDKEFNPIADLITKCKIAYRFITSKKAIIITDDQVDVFNMEMTEVVLATSQIIGELSVAIYEDIDQNKKINNLVYGSN
jgi:hypothetical protein